MIRTQFLETIVDIVFQNEVVEFLLLLAQRIHILLLHKLYSLCPLYWCRFISNEFKHIEQVAFLHLEHVLQKIQFVLGKTCFIQRSQQIFTGFWV